MWRQNMTEVGESLTVKYKNFVRHHLTSVIFYRMANRTNACFILVTVNCCDQCWKKPGFFRQTLTHPGLMGGFFGFWVSGFLSLYGAN